MVNAPEFSTGRKLTKVKPLPSLVFESIIPIQNTDIAIRTKPETVNNTVNTNANSSFIFDDAVVSAMGRELSLYLMSAVRGSSRPFADTND